ncbi:MAG: DUF4249 family protein [Cyclobacteriaceae bacterium]|nr:DUF4249 family protein [Cyclobacteriaceae bacterium]
MTKQLTDNAKIVIGLFILATFSGCLSCNQHDEGKVLIAGFLYTHYHPALDFRLHENPSPQQASVVVSYYKKYAIDDAKVTISSDSQSVELEPVEEEAGTFYRDTQSSLVVVPGRTYYLDVKLKNGRRFTSQTTVPQDPIIEFPAQDDTLYPGDGMRTYVVNFRTRGNYRFSYSKDASTYAALRISTISPIDVVSYSYHVPKPDSLPTSWDPSVDVLEYNTELLTLDSGLSVYSWHLAKYAYGLDSVYAAEIDHKYARSPIELSSNISGEGGIGCFGSYSYSAVHYYLNRNKP